MTAVMLLIVTILYNACRKLLTSDDGNRQLQKTEKIPEEHDERFATGKPLIILRFPDFVSDIR